MKIDLSDLNSFKKKGFKVIEEYPNYLINKNGDVYSLLTKKILATSLNNGKYKTVSLVKNKISKTKTIHSMVCKTFIDKPKLMVNHKDGDKTNNNYKNLEWVTAKENINHSFKNGMSKIGEKHGNSLFTKKDIFKIYDMIKKKIPQNEIAKIYKVKNSTINRIATGKSWVKERLEYNSLHKNEIVKISGMIKKNDMKIILQLIKDGKKQNFIARKFNVHPTTISKALTKIKHENEFIDV